jgi:hypothetical protein
MASLARRQVSPLTLVSTVHSLRPPAKFDAAFIERRFREHRNWQEQKAAEDSAEIVSEVLSAYAHTAKVRAQRGKRLVG